MDAGRVFLTDSANSMKKDPMVPVLKSFTQVVHITHTSISSCCQQAASVVVRRLVAMVTKVPPPPSMR